MHMLSRKDSSSEELETLQKFRNTTTVITGDVEVQTSEEAQVYVHDLELLVTVNPRRDACSLVIGQNLRRSHRVGRWSKATADQEWENNSLQHGKLLSYCCARIVDRFIKLERKFVFHIVTAGYSFESSNTTK